MQDQSPKNHHDSDFLPWILAAAAVLIMAAAVRINANESSALGPQVHDPGEQDPAAQADH